MALINCPECGKEVSDRAPACPNCGFPISGESTASQPNKTAEIEKFLDLALKGLQAQNSELVEKYCQCALELDPKNSRAWAISAAANAVEYTSDENKSGLAERLYDCIFEHITALLNIAHEMPLIYAPQFVAQCMCYHGELLAGIPCIPIPRLAAELQRFAAMDQESKKSILPKKRLIFSARCSGDSWDVRFRNLLVQKGRLQP